jgi:hypothetical protein
MHILQIMAKLEYALVHSNTRLKCALHTVGACVGKPSMVRLDLISNKSMKGFEVLT